MIFASLFSKNINFFRIFFRFFITIKNMNLSIFNSILASGIF
nr:MAG TPA: hypothetical protein [Caudoviricetes sp.]DAP51897.1 MAG TPA: hypothetical protein [Caudoviricetes sp.]